MPRRRRAIPKRWLQKNCLASFAQATAEVRETEDAKQGVDSDSRGPYAQLCSGARSARIGSSRTHRREFSRMAETRKGPLVSPSVVAADLARKDGSYRRKTGKV